MKLHPDFLSRPIAHRAYHDRADRRPENSRAAISAAIAAGYAIEIDLQPAADHVPMVFHDYTLERLTGASGKVCDYPADELQCLHLLDSDESIPTFAEVLRLVDGQVPLLVELKEQGRMVLPEGIGGGPLERETAKALSGYSGPVAVMSFCPDTLARFHAHAPEVCIGLTTCAYTDRHFDQMDPAQRERRAGIVDFEDLGCQFVSHYWRDLGMARIARLKADGAAILCWTIGNPQDEAEARQIAANVTFEGYGATQGYGATPQS
ncbi:phosphodiesterase [Rhodobacteraceae bacterium]|nr:phosphodiesterase [Paracoccaceae bacterium]